jgi:hypothetical protein
MTCRAQYDRSPPEGGPRSPGPVEAAFSRRLPRGISPGMEIADLAGLGANRPVRSDVGQQVFVGEDLDAAVGGQRFGGTLRLALHQDLASWCRPGALARRRGTRLKGRSFTSSSRLTVKPRPAQTVVGDPEGAVSRRHRRSVGCGGVRRQGLEPRTR